MPQRPIALSLMLCDQVVFEQGTQKPYLLGVFTGIVADSFPTTPQRFDLFAALTDGQGDVMMKLQVMHLDSNQEVYSQQMTVRFAGPLEIINLRFRVRQLVYDSVGTYLFTLTVDDEEIASRRVHVHERGQSP
jgi:hypothetical protein